MIFCCINGCDNEADTLDDETRLPICWPCNDELAAVRGGQTATLWEAAQDGFRLGVFGGLFSRFWG